MMTKSLTYTIESFPVWSNRYWIVDPTGKRVHAETNYDQAEYLCRIMNSSASKANKENKQ